jgi:hypothetical protein
MSARFLCAATKHIRHSLLALSKGDPVLSKWSVAHQKELVAKLQAEEALLAATQAQR